ncbi:MAG: asparagine synthase (glutamine-hydrolyzing) [Desulfobacteraceae bacterium]|nr:asparagine synthase (glutamine-hydrolyzing) [Desulfobacteraceae bacterium]
MISGIYQRKKGRSVNPDWFTSISTPPGVTKDKDSICINGPIGFLSDPPFMSAEYKSLRPAATQDNELNAVFTGAFYNSAELSRIAGSDSISSYDQNTSLLILKLYQKIGINFIEKVNGKFAFALWDKSRQLFFLVRDRFGIEPMYYYYDDDKIVFSSNIQTIFRYVETVKSLNMDAVRKFLLFNYNPGFETFFKNVYNLQPGHILIVRQNQMDTHRFWQLSFKDTSHHDETEISERLLDHLRDAVRIRTNHDEVPGILLSGGMDSSTVARLSSEVLVHPVKTFSYRCKNESFDESHYARYMAKSINADHYEVEYYPSDILLTSEIIKSMNEPFCDIGINNATHILGRAASQKVNYVLTGDGGDELFGGHPVYEADKISAYFDKIPSIFKKTLSLLSFILPDSDKKKNLIVKTKRFFENCNLPRELISHRWRVYYSVSDLGKLLNTAAPGNISETDLFNDILKINHEADGPDLLSRALYSDYHTVIDFYLRRNDLNRKFGLETRFPLLDHRLVEFCASISSNMKINGWFDTKYIFKKAMQNILPHNIIYRKDKLGHSIPLKNWMRDNDIVKQYLFHFISEEVLSKRGLFNISFVQKMIREHLTKKRNNSHRLWALAVLEMWLREHYDY